MSHTMQLHKNIALWLATATGHLPFVVLSVLFKMCYHDTDDLEHTKIYSKYHFVKNISLCFRDTHIKYSLVNND